MKVRLTGLPCGAGEAAGGSCEGCGCGLASWEAPGSVGAEDGAPAPESSWRHTVRCTA